MNFNTVSTAYQNAKKIHGPKNILPTYLDMLRMCFLMIMYIL